LQIKYFLIVHKTVHSADIMSYTLSHAVRHDCEKTSGNVFPSFTVKTFRNDLDDLDSNVVLQAYKF